ncbi:DUF2956 family protein [Vibrio mediterranei]|uniref:DUF2956 family protein n=1 Tax=Vibrio mediterranei TaxID=689 RepID=UPI0020A368DC|nr:DUF2956 family protein [Vibrio mediterranei]
MITAHDNQYFIENESYVDLFFPYLKLKEQTKLIAQGIEKGIAQFKKQQKEKKRQADKALKKQKRDKQQREHVEAGNQTQDVQVQEVGSTRLPWMLLVFSWIGFIAYVALN